MQNSSWMDVLKPSEHLVQEELYVIVWQRLIWFNDLRQICFHKLVHNIDLVKVFSGFRLQDGLDSDDIIMLK